MLHSVFLFSLLFTMCYFSMKLNNFQDNLSKYEFFDKTDK